MDCNLYKFYETKTGKARTNHQENSCSGLDPLENTQIMEVGISISGIDFSPQLQENESVSLEQSQIHLHFNENDLGEGKLFLGTKRVYWISSSNPHALNLAVNYHSVGLHAISQDLDSWPVPCLYCQLDIDLGCHSFICEKLSEVCGRTISSAEVASPTSDPDNQDEDDEAILSELRFAPSDSSSLSTLFSVFTEMSVLNSDSKPTDDQMNGFDCVTSSDDNIDEWMPEDDEITENSD